MVGQIAWENGIDAITVVMMRKKKTARPTSKKASGKAPYKRRRPSLLPRIVVPGVSFIGKRSIDKLLELAGADTKPRSRRDLVNVLRLAQMAHEDEKDIFPDNDRGQKRSTNLRKTLKRRACSSGVSEGTMISATLALCRSNSVEV